MFFDQIKLHVQGGDGGNGASAFRREKFVAQGGPSGGNGGRGGHVVLKVDPQLNTLIHFRHRNRFKGDRGIHGGGKDQHGKAGADKIVSVPPGTIVRQADTEILLGDLVEPGQEFIVAQGGRGGRGNAAFKSSTRQAPRMAEKGAPGQALWIQLELKIIADVGIAGVPNAGKSTLLASVTAAKPKIANYPFTTLQPNLGVVLVDHRDFVMADIPGLIEGAHEGVGLGHQFLRHVERTRLLIHLLDGASADPLSEFDQINEELRLFNPTLAEKPQILVLNKHDLPFAHEHWPAVQERAAVLDLPVFFVSAASRHGVAELMGFVLTKIDELPEVGPLVEVETPVFTLESDSQAFEVETDEGVFYVSGSAIDHLVAQTYWDIDEAVQQAQFKLESMGVLPALREAGVEPGDTVFLGELELEWMW
ncbi:MAG: GTPase ObgE [Chloroflexota bacterium]